MAFKVRRVVTRHDPSGHALVKSDGVMDNVQTLRPGLLATTIWTTSTFPANNDGYDDPSGRAVGTALKGGTVFR